MPPTRDAPDGPARSRKSRPRPCLRSLGAASIALVALAAVVVALPGATAASGGPDGFGYRFADSHEDGGPRSGSPTIPGIVREEVPAPPVDPVPIGFPFPFYGERYTEVRICPQGYLTFDEETPCVPAPDEDEDDLDTLAPDAVIAPYWRDDGRGFEAGTISVSAGLDTGSGSLLDLASPVASPLVVEFSGQDCSDQTWTHAQVWLFPNGTIDFRYPLYPDDDSRWNAVCSPLIGIGSPDGSTSLRYPRPDTFHVEDHPDYDAQLEGEAIRFTPPCETRALADGEDPRSACAREIAPDADPIAAGWDHVCTLLRDGDVACWGADDRGQAEDYRGGDAIGVAAGGDTTCILVGDRTGGTAVDRADGDVVCRGAETMTMRAGDVADMAVDATGDVCVLFESGDVTCEGLANYTGGDAIDVDVADFGYGNKLACVATSRGTVDCWGHSRAPSDVGPDWDPVEVAVSETEIDVCFRGGETGRVACTGSIERPKAEDARDLAAASGRVCAADLGGIVCPDHDHGLLLDRRERATHVAVGTGFECALTTRGNVSCFGSLSRGYREGDAGRSDAGTRAYATERVREIVHDPSPS